jgi:hypothetical protein
MCQVVSLADVLLQIVQLNGERLGIVARLKAAHDRWWCTVRPMMINERAPD